MRNNVIWGIGHYGRLCAMHLGLNNVQFFIDSDKSKTGEFLGKKVITPDRVSEWTDIHIYIPLNYKAEIMDTLKKYATTVDISVSVYGNNALITEERAEEEYKRAISELEKIDLNVYKGGIVFWTRVWAADREYAKGYINLITSQEMLVVSEAYWINKDETEKCLKNKTVVSPSFSSCETVNVKNVLERPKVSNDLSDDTSIDELVHSIVSNNPAVSEDAAYYKAYKTYGFMDAVLKKGRFRYAIINGSDVPEHRLLSSICKKYGVNIIYTHPAVLPGTLSFDPSGDVGDSIVTVFYKEFLGLPISPDDIAEAQKVLNYLRLSGINRKPQPKHDWLKHIKDRIKNGRPKIFYAGQNDMACSMTPYTEKSRIFQSPIFRSTFECVLYLAEICKKNDWNFIYKPHPMYIGNGDEGLPENVIYISSGNINDIVDFADLTVTIRSTTNYVALIRKKPVLMLGYTQTRGQGCTYEAYKKEDIERQIVLALTNGFTNEHAEKFIEHVARLLKYYLYDDMGQRKIRYGMNIPCKMEEFFSLEKRLKNLGKR